MREPHSIDACTSVEDAAYMCRLFVFQAQGLEAGTSVRAVWGDQHCEDSVL